MCFLGCFYPVYIFWVVARASLWCLVTMLLWCFFVSRVFWVVARRRLFGFVVLCSEWLQGITRVFGCLPLCFYLDG